MPRGLAKKLEKQQDFHEMMTFEGCKASTGWVSGLSRADKFDGGPADSGVGGAGGEAEIAWVVAGVVAAVKSAVPSLLF